MFSSINQTKEYNSNHTTNNERRKTMKNLFVTITTVFVLAGLFIAPVPASALMFIDYYTPTSKPYFGKMEVYRDNSLLDAVSLRVTPIAGLNDVKIAFYPLSRNNDGSYVGTTTASYSGSKLDFHLWIYRLGNYAFVRILTSRNGVFIDDRDEIFILYRTDKLFN